MQKFLATTALIATSALAFSLNTDPVGPEFCCEVFSEANYEGETS